VTADRVVIATNAYQHRLPAFRRAVKPVWSYAMVSEPIPDRWLDELPWAGREGFVEASNFIVFARLTAENRLLIGGGPAPYRYGRDMDERHLRDERVERALRAAFTRYFPSWGGLRFTHSYGGCVAMTRDLVPHVGALAGDTFYAHGYCGNGIAMTHTAGKALRDLVLERDGGYSTLPFVNGRKPRFPPEPIAYAGAALVSRVLAWQDRHPEVVRRQLI
jgi:glycine/D-amino acid oxidase-like deaminating enzyme